MNKKIFAIILLLLCAIFAAIPAMAAKKTLTFSMETEIPVLDPQKSNAAPSFTVISHVFENLIRRVDVPSNLFKQYYDKGDAKLFFNGALDWMKFNLRDNPEKPWLANKNFRLAVGWAIDREAYTLASTKGLYVPALRFILPIVQGVDGEFDTVYSG
jgi:ABC-type oligopeptide transport system substrate-binding subunit